MRYEVPEGHRVVYRYTLEPSKRPVPVPPSQRKLSGAHPGEEFAYVLTEVTTATILDPEGKFVASGEAYKNPAEQFCRRIGRDIARGRAAKELTLSTLARRA